MINTQTKQAAVRIGRLILGALFMFSGFSKCIDPVGGAIKIEDYFVAWGMADTPWWICMALSIVQNIVEFTTGFMLVCGAYMRVSTAIALAFMVFYTPLTLYIAIANPVSDCGCFGDAMKITNWQTFGKNIVFLAIAVVVFLWQKAETRHDKRWKQLAMTGTALVVSTLVSIKGVTDEPIMDFRPYAVGTNIPEAMTTPEGAEMTEYKTTFILEKDGKIAEFDEHNYPYDDSTWVYRDSRTEVLKEGYVPPIADFTLTDEDGNDQSESLLHASEQTILAIVPKLEKASDEELAQLGHQWVMAQENGLPMYVCTSSAQGEFYRTDSVAGSVGLEFLFGDETMLKTIVRSRVGIIVLQQGTIVAKYSIGNMPLDRDMKNPGAAYATNQRAAYEWLMILCLALACGIVWLLIHRGHRRGHGTVARSEQRDMNVPNAEANKVSE